MGGSTNAQEAQSNPAGRAMLNSNPGSKKKAIFMVGVAQLVESRIVIPVVVGSSPIVHPNISNKL